ncbi:MAG TPA: hypothetical protein VL069_08475, partial [Opitutus sp.]|nr:hypothetical protein [Opitutus sp.]
MSGREQMGGLTSRTLARNGGSLRSRGALALAWLASGLIAAIFLMPLLWMVAASFREESRIFHHDADNWLTTAGWTASNYIEGWRHAALGPAMVNSLLQVSLIAGCGLLVNAMAAYAFARLNFRGRELIFGLV